VERSRDLRRIHLLAATCLALGALIVPQMALAQMSGTAHDFSATLWAGGNICIVCHTPHNADMTVSPNPLWNHEVTSSTFTVYASATLDYTPEQPRGTSLLCLSCHDGVVAVNSYGGATGDEFVSGSPLIGTNLMDEHPISIYWDHQTESQTCSNCHNAHPFGLNDEVPFPEHYVECASCHDVHNSTGIPKLLRKTMTGSALCFHCHNK
jgi:predicted CXXCH cytochrome family protein